MKIHFLGVMCLSIIACSAQASDYTPSIQEKIIIVCAQQGYDTGTSEFEECRMRMANSLPYAPPSANLMYNGPVYQNTTPASNNDLLGYVLVGTILAADTWANDDEDEYYYDRRHQHHGRRHYYQEPPHGKHDHYINQHGQDCKKTHRGWVMCK